MTLIHQNSPTCLCCHILPTFSGQGPRVPSKSSKAKASPPNQAPGHKTKCFHSPVSGVTATELRPGLLRDTQAGKSPAAESSTHPEGCTIWLLPFTSSAVLSCLSLQMKTYLHFFFFHFWDKQCHQEIIILKAAILKNVVTYAFPSKIVEVLTSLNLKFYWRIFKLFSGFSGLL